MSGPARVSRRLAASRRSFLKAVGAGTAALPFYRLLEDSAVNAQAGLPLRFLCVYHPHGIAAEYFNLRPGETETSFDLRYDGSVLSPLDDAATYGASFKDKLLIIDGVDLAVAGETGTGGHDASLSILTGSGGYGADKKPKTSSIDQFLAREKGLGMATRYPTLALGVGMDNVQAGNILAYAAGGEPLPKIIDPAQTFDTIFSDLIVSSDPAAQAEAARKRRRGQSVIDFIKGDIARLQPRLAPPEQQKLDQHLTAIREIEKQLAGVSGASAVCTSPPRPVAMGNSDPALDFPKLRMYNGGEPYFDRITDLQIDLMAQALACDLTRFATLFMTDPGKELTDMTPAIPVGVHEQVAHQYRPVTGMGDDATVASRLRLARVNRYSYAKVARLMQRLHDTGVLDATLMYVTSDMGDPALHSSRNVPTVIAGGTNGIFKMGRHLTTVECPPTDPSWCPNRKTVSHNALLVSICNAFGVAIDSYGAAQNPDYNKGPFPGLTG
jgi:hypothetical protein